MPIIHDKLARNLYLASSTMPGAGIGVFTDRYIAAGVPICEYKGELLQKDSDISLADSTYFLGTGKYTIDPNPKSCKNDTVIGYGGWINDKCNQSCRMKLEDIPIMERKQAKLDAGYNCNWWIRPDGKKAIIVSTRAIERGEELFIDYGDGYWAARE